MNISSIKLLSWVGSAALFGYLVWFIVEFKTAEAGRQTVVAELAEDATKRLGAVEAPPPEKDDLVAYGSVRDHLGLLNWTGKVEKVVEPPKGPKVEDQPKPKKPVSDLLSVIYVQYHSRGDRSAALVKYRDPALVTAPKAKTKLVLGDTLPKPYEYVFVEAIEVDGVSFAFSDDEERESEWLETADFQEGVSLITPVGEGGVVMPTEESRISQTPTATPWRPSETTPIGKNKWRIGTDDVEYISENWSEVLARDVRDRRHRDAATGKYDGIEITDVSPGSFAERHGVEQGDVIKSINGHPVTSKTEAINFVKNNDDLYDSWEVIIERLGRDVSLTYEEPAP